MTAAAAVASQSRREPRGGEVGPGRGLGPREGRMARERGGGVSATTVRGQGGDGGCDGVARAAGRPLPRLWRGAVRARRPRGVARGELPPRGGVAATREPRRPPRPPCSPAYVCTLGNAPPRPPPSVPPSFPHHAAAVTPTTASPSPSPSPSPALRPPPLPFPLHQPHGRPAYPPPQTPASPPPATATPGGGGGITNPRSSSAARAATRSSSSAAAAAGASGNAMRPAPMCASDTQQNTTMA